MIKIAKSFIYHKLHFKWLIFQYICIKYNLRLSYSLNKDAVHILQEIFLKSIYNYEFQDSPKVIIDIGGHYGYFALYTSKKFKHNCTILSIEPSLSNIAKFKKNIESTGVKNVTLVEGALAGKNSQRDLYLSLSQNHSLYQDYSTIRLGSESILCYSLKSLLEKYNLNRVDLMKIDCEGSEHEILMECDKETLSRINYLFIEMHPINHSDYSIPKTLKYLQENYFESLTSKTANNIDNFQYFNSVILLKNKAR